MQRDEKEHDAEYNKILTEPAYIPPFKYIKKWRNRVPRLACLYAAMETGDLHDLPEPGSEEAKAFVRNEVPTTARKAQMVQEFLALAGPGQPLYACAACGIRDPLIEYSDLISLSSVQGVFRVSGEQLRNVYFRINEPYRAAVSIYKDPASGVFYHVHPELVEVHDGIPMVRLCDDCHKDARDSRIPRYSIAAGLDYGCWARVQAQRPGDANFEDLNLAERMVLSPVRTIQLIVQLQPAQAGMGYEGLVGHAISFAQDAPSQLGRTFNLLASVQQLPTTMFITFVGPKGQFDHFKGAIHRMFAMSAPKLMVWLEGLLQLNPSYRQEVNVHEQELAAACQVAISQMLEMVTLVDRPEHVARVAQAATADTARVRVPEQGTGGGPEDIHLVDHMMVHEPYMIEDPASTSVDAFFQLFEVRRCKLFTSLHCHAEPNPRRCPRTRKRPRRRRRLSRRGR